ncbi:hypothetical protein BASA81_013341 [Batrachochytrium salamandrivorans]|nr:hypothetical protein BASA81_013341 [Batrachochytrium salamandrivorans]
MQFFHLFSFVVVASYAAALPQPAGLSEKYSDSVNTNLATGLETRSYQPESNSYKDSATLVSLKRRDDYEGSSKGSSGDDSEGSSEGPSGANSKGPSGDDSKKSPKENSGSGSSSPPTTIPERIVWNIDTSFDKAELGALLLSSKIEEVKNNHDDVPKNVKAAGRVIGGNAGVLLLEYFQNALYVANSMKNWVETTGKDIVSVIKFGLGDAEYSKVESSLKEAYEILTDRANGYLKVVNAALSNIEKDVSTAKQYMEVIQVSFMYLFEAYIDYFEKLGLQLAKFGAGKNIHKSLSNAGVSLVDFTRDQRDLYDDIKNGL